MATPHTPAAVRSARHGAMVRVSTDAHDTLRALAADSGESMQAIVDHAIHCYCQQRIIAGTLAAFRTLRADPAAWQALRDEDAEWDSTLADGLDDEVSASHSQPLKCEIWRIALDSLRGHEQGRTRPCVVISEDWFNTAQRGVVVVIPLTSRLRGIPLHVVVQPPEGGLHVASAVTIEDMRSCRLNVSRHVSAN